MSFIKAAAISGLVAAQIIAADVKAIPVFIILIRPRSAFILALNCLAYSTIALLIM